MINLYGEEIDENIVEEEVIKAPSVPSLFDWLKSINNTKEDLSSIDMKGYEPFIINKGLSQSEHTVGFANLMNINSHLPKRMQYAFFLGGIPKSRSYSKWAKSSHDKNLKPFMNATGLSRDKAIAAMRILSKEQIKRVLKPVGGKIKN